VNVNGTLVETKIWTFTLESTHFIFNKCPIYTHDGASSKFSTNSQETDYSVGLRFNKLFRFTTLKLSRSYSAFKGQERVIVMDLRQRIQKLKLHYHTNTVTLLSLHSVVAHTEPATDEFEAGFRLPLLLL
jgi:hypothetical protein